MILGSLLGRKALPVDPELVARFVDLEIRRQALYGARKIKAANKVFDEFYRTCARELRALPDGGRSTLLQLVQHENPEVRLAAAYLLLPLDQRRAVKVLEPIAESRLWPTALNAEMTLKEWRGGRLKVDWFMKD